MNDPLDVIMAVMEAAFDPAFGEAWNRRQVSDALLLANTHYALAPGNAGFALSRTVLEEEELLLIAVHPDERGKGVGKALLQQFIAEAASRGSRKLFLEMRAGNPAEHLYRACGFEQIGYRKAYYRRGSGAPIDAVTFGLYLH